MRLDKVALPAWWKSPHGLALKTAGLVGSMNPVQERSDPTDGACCILFSLAPFAALLFLRSLALSILSMLSSAKGKRSPEDNAAREC